MLSSQRTFSLGKKFRRMVPRVVCIPSQKLVPVGMVFSSLSQIHLFLGMNIDTRRCHVQIGPELRQVPPNGTITNDKFCLSRHVRLHLSHWHLAQHSQPNVAASVSYPSDRDESTLRHHGGGHEETPMEMPPSASRADGSPAPLGYSLPVASRDGLPLPKRS